MVNQSNLSSNNDIKKAICYMIFTALSLSPLFGGEYFIPVYLLIYFDFLKNSWKHPKDSLSKQCLVGFIISISATLFYGIYHFDALMEDSGSAKYTLIGLGWFAIGFMVIDSARFQFSFYGLKKHVLAILLIISSFVSVVFLFGKIIFEDPAVVDRVLSFSNRDIFWSDLSPNHVDNILLYIIMLLIWTVSYCSKRRFFVLAIAFINLLLLIYLFYRTGSRGGGLGFLIASLIIGVTYFVRQDKKVYLLYFAVVLGIMLTVVFLTSSRFTHGFKSAINLAMSSPSVEGLFADSIQHMEENRSAVLEILNDPAPDSTPPVTIRVAKICWPNGKFDRRDRFSSIDPSLVFRHLLFLEGIKIWLHEPYFGHGNYNRSDILSTYEDSEPCIVGFSSHIHNHYMNLLIYYGVAGLITFIFLMLYSMYMFDRMCKLNGDKLLYLPTFYFISLLVENNFDLTFDRNSDLLSVLFCVLMLFSISLCKDSELKGSDTK